MIPLLAGSVNLSKTTILASFLWNLEALPLLQGFYLCSFPTLMHGWLLLIFQISNHTFFARRRWFWPCSLGSRFWCTGVCTESWSGTPLGVIPGKGLREAELDRERSWAVMQSWKKPQPIPLGVLELGMALQNCTVSRQRGWALAPSNQSGIACRLFLGRHSVCGSGLFSWGWFLEGLSCEPVMANVPATEGITKGSGPEGRVKAFGKRVLPNHAVLISLPLLHTAFYQLPCPLHFYFIIHFKINVSFCSSLTFSTWVKTLSVIEQCIVDSQFWLKKNECVNAWCGLIT